MNAYSGGNLGDGAIVRLMCEELAARGAHVSVMADDPGDRSRYDVPVVPPLLDVWGQGARGLRGAAAEGWLAARQQLSPGRAGSIFAAADLVLSAGGGYLYDDGSIGSRRNLLRRLHTLSLALRSGRPVVAFSQSIGPFAASLPARLTGAVLRRCTLVLVRDESSLAQCARLGVACRLADDIAFTARPVVDSAVERVLAEHGGNGRAPLAATVIDWGFGGARDGPQRLGRYLEALAGSLAVVGRRADRPIVVVSQVNAHGRDSDEALSLRLARLIGQTWKASCVDLRGLSLPQVVGFYSRMHLVLASRLHSAVFACAGGTPAVVIGYLPKSFGVMRRAGLGSFVCAIESVTSARLTPLLLDALARRDELAADVARRVPELRRSALDGLELALAAAA